MDTNPPTKWNAAAPLKKIIVRGLAGCLLLLSQVAAPLLSVASGWAQTGSHSVDTTTPLYDGLTASFDNSAFDSSAFDSCAFDNSAFDNSVPGAVDNKSGVPGTTPGGIDSAASRKEAMRLLSTIKQLDSSAWWPKIRPALFLANLRNNIEYPLSIYQGSNTNFCGYAALTYLPLHDDPGGWLRFMLALYRDGEASFNGILFRPSAPIHAATGTLVFKGVLDICPADQLWFLVLADHFRGYLNIFSPLFRDGSEDTFWAAVNLGKFCRMVRRLGGYKTQVRGSDLIRPSIHDLYDYISAAMKTGITFLYVDNTYLYKKNHNSLKLHIPTHYLVLTDIRRDDGPEGPLTITYWDYGGKSLRKVSEEFLKKITYGIVHCTKAD